MENKTDVKVEGNGVESRVDKTILCELTGYGSKTLYTTNNIINEVVKVKLEALDSIFDSVDIQIYPYNGTSKTFIGVKKGEQVSHSIPWNAGRYEIKVWGNCTKDIPTASQVGDARFYVSDVGTR